MKNNYEIQPIKPVDYSAIASTYAQVFAGEPWREVSRCISCGTFSNQAPAENGVCACGGTYSLQAYPLIETIEYIGQELAKPDAVGLFLTQVNLLKQFQGTAYGFGWGFKMTPQELAQKKYRTQEMQELIAELLIHCGFFYYVSEVGVLPTLQGLGLGKKLTNKVVDSAQREGYRQFVVRTNEDSAMRYILEKMGMKPIVGLQTGIIDTENESRVLFVGER